MLRLFLHACRVHIGILLGFLLFLGLETAAIAAHEIENAATLAQDIRELAGDQSPVETRFHLFHQAEKDADRVFFYIEQTIAPGWHVYWRNPGDTGFAPRIEPDDDQTFALGSLDYPLPARFVVGDLVNYGHAGRAIFAAPVERRAQDAGSAFTGVFHWLVCKDVCIPQKQRFVLAWPQGQPAMRDSAVHERFIRQQQAIEAQAVAGEVVLDKDALFLWVPLRIDAISEAYFFPYNRDIPSKAQAFRLLPTGILLRLPRKDTAFGPGMLVVTADGKKKGYSLSSLALREKEQAPWMEGANVKNARWSKERPQEELAADGFPAPVADLRFFTVFLLLAFLGGLVLNAMPCIFPLLFLKMSSLTQGQQRQKPASRLSAFAYALGVFMALETLCVVFYLLKKGGEAAGLGLYLQSPLFIYILGGLFVWLALASFFPLSSAAAGLSRLERLRQESGPFMAQFVTGALLVAVSTACMGPFLAGPIAYAMQAGLFQSLLVFAFLAAGLATPMTLLLLVPAIAPAAYARLPRPGAWMLRIKQACLFPLLATIGWLMWVIGRQRDVDASFLFFLGLLLAMAIYWILSMRPVRISAKITKTLALAAVVLLWIHAGQRLVAPKSEVAQSVPYSSAALNAALDEGRAVFVNVTAAWCLTCQLNEARFFSRESFWTILRAHDMLYMKADWTERDTQVYRYMQSFSQPGIPLYVVYAPQERQGQKLPVFFSRRDLLDALDQ